jgi:outer membrane protein assembly factor BamB
VALAGLIASPAVRADLTTYGYGNARLGVDLRRVAISSANARRLSLAWRTNVGGAVNGQPLVVDGIRIGRRTRNVVYVATEHGRIVALDADTGRVLWRRHVGDRTITPDCQASPDGVFGVTGTMLIDRAAGRLYAVDVNGKVWALRLASGKVVRGWPVTLRSSSGDFYWSALALSRGRLYVPVASLCDGGYSHGGIVAVDVRHPRHTIRWQTVSGPGLYGGGIWGWGGVSVDGSGDVYAATGNSQGTSSESVGYSEAVVRLSPDLGVQQFNQPLVPPFLIGDRDFGTTPVLINAPGCPPQLVALNKDGDLFLYDRQNIAAGPVQALWVAANSPQSPIPLLGVPAFDPATRTLVLVSPSTPSTPGLQMGVQALTLGASCRFAVRWSRWFDPPDAGSPPTIARGVIYLGSGRNGFLRAFRLSDGRQLWNWRPSTQAIFAAPAVDRATMIAAGWDGNVWAFKPGG